MNTARTPHMRRLATMGRRKRPVVAPVTPVAGAGSPDSAALLLLVNSRSAYLARTFSPLSGPCCDALTRPSRADGGCSPEGCIPRSMDLSAGMGAQPASKGAQWCASAEMTLASCVVHPGLPAFNPPTARASRALPATARNYAGAKRPGGF